MGIIYGALSPALLENGFVLAPAAGTSGLRMDASGNVAIGQSSVSSGYIFDVSGNAQIDGSFNVLRGGTFGGQVNAASLNLGGAISGATSISGTSLNLNGGTCVITSLGDISGNSLSLTGSSITSAGAISGTSLNLNGGTPASNSISTNSLTASGDIYVNGITVGRGSGNISSNTAIGANTLATNNGNGYDNSAFGSNALNLNTSGNNNSAFGAMALNNNSTGVWNSAFGIEALRYNTTSNYNSAFGANALGEGVPGRNNSAFGTGALAVTTGYNNTAVGANSLANYIVDTNNYSVQTAIGYRSGAGSDGQNSGSAFPDIGGYFNTYIGPFTGVNTQNAIYSNSVAIGYTTAITASNQIMLGNGSSIAVVTLGTMTALSFNANSDYRIKENVETLDQTFTVDNLRPVQYDTKDAKNHAIGFIAHEVQEHYPFLVDGEKDGEKTQSINYNGFIGILVNEIQQLKKTVAKQAETIDKQTEIINQILARFS
jgi:hypothetical protein